MRKQKIKKSGFYGETIFNIAVYNCSRNCGFERNSSKRALSQLLAITNYLDNLPQTSEKK